MKLKTTLLACLLALPLYGHTSTHGEGGQEGHGGEGFVGPTFFSIAANLDEVTHGYYNFQKVLDAPLVVKPESERPTLQDGTPVDAESFYSEDALNGARSIHIYTGLIEEGDCEKIYNVFSHELFIHMNDPKLMGRKGMGETSLSYSKSKPLINRLIKAGLICKTDAEAEQVKLRVNRDLSTLERYMEEASGHKIALQMDWHRFINLKSSEAMILAHLLEVFVQDSQNLSKVHDDKFSDWMAPVKTVIFTRHTGPNILEIKKQDSTLRVEIAMNRFTWNQVNFRWAIMNAIRPEGAPAAESGLGLLRIKSHSNSGN